MSSRRPNDGPKVPAKSLSELLSDPHFIFTIASLCVSLGIFFYFLYQLLCAIRRGERPGSTSAENTASTDSVDRRSGGVGHRERRGFEDAQAVARRKKSDDDGDNEVPADDVAARARLQKRILEQTPVALPAAPGSQRAGLAEGAKLSGGSSQAKVESGGTLRQRKK